MAMAPCQIGNLMQRERFDKNRPFWDLFNALGGSSEETITSTHISPHPSI
jgi:hypothetical protein